MNEAKVKFCLICNEKVSRHDDDCRRVEGEIHQVTFISIDEFKEYKSRKGIKTNVANELNLKKSKDKLDELKKICPQPDCGFINEKDASECVNCGKSLKKTKEKTPTNSSKPILVYKSKPIILKFENNKAKFGRDYIDVNEIKDNLFISREHCLILQLNGKFFVVDTSKNGTYINNLRIAPGKENEIKSGDTLKLANLDFVFEYAN